MLRFFGGVKVINTKKIHAKHKIAEVEKSGWDGLTRHQGIGSVLSTGGSLRQGVNMPHGQV